MGFKGFKGYVRLDLARLYLITKKNENRHARKELIASQVGGP